MALVASRKMPVAGLHMGPDGAADDVARFEFGAALAFHEADAGLVDEDGAFAAHGFADERHGVAADIERGGVELDEFEVGEGGAGAGGEDEALADGAGRIGAVAVEAAEAAGGDDDAAAAEHAGAALSFGHGEHAGNFAVARDDFGGGSHLPRR